MTTEIHNHFHFSLPGYDRDLVEAVTKAVFQEMKMAVTPIIQTMSDKLDGLIQHVDALDKKLQSVKADLAAIVAAGALSAEDAAALQAVIDKIDAEDTKVVADTV